MNKIVVIAGKSYELCPLDGAMMRLHSGSTLVSIRAWK